MPITVDEIVEQLKPWKPCGRRQASRYLKAAKVRPLLKRRVRPQLYPDEATKQVLTYLGVTMSRKKARAK